MQIASSVAEQLKTLFAYLLPLNYCLVLSPEMKILSILVKLSFKNLTWTFPALHYFTRKLEFVSNILWMIVEFTCY